MRLPSGNAQMDSQKGQIIIEYILLLVIVVGLSASMYRFLKDTAFVQKLTFEPWGKLSGVIQCGVWKSCQVDKNSATPGLHPSMSSRRISLDPTK